MISILSNSTVFIGIIFGLTLIKLSKKRKKWHEIYFKEKMEELYEYKTKMKKKYWLMYLTGIVGVIISALYLYFQEKCSIFAIYWLIQISLLTIIFVIEIMRFMFDKNFLASIKNKRKN